MLKANEMFRKHDEIYVFKVLYLLRWINLHKTNTANEDLVSRPKNGCKVRGGLCYTNCFYHSNS